MNKTRSARWIYQVTTAVALAILVGACANSTGSDGAESATVDTADEQSEHSAMLLRYCNKLYKAKDLYVAASMCRRAHTINPTDPAPLYTLAEIYGDMGAKESKAEAYRTALKINPDDIEALYGLGKSSIDLGRYDIAVAQLERAIALESGDPRFYNAMGVAKDQLGDHDTAQMLYREGLAIDPDNVSLRNNLGLSLTLSGKHEQSVAMLREVAREPGAGSIGSKNLALAATNAAQPGANMAMDMQEGTDDDPMSLTSPDEEMGIAMGEDATEESDPAETEESAGQSSMAAAMAKPMPRAMTEDSEQASQAADAGSAQPRSGSIGNSSVAMNNTERNSAEQAAGASMPTSAFTTSSSSVPSPEKIRNSAEGKSDANTNQVAAVPSGSMASNGTTYAVQVGSYGSKQGAERGWSVISDAAGDLLADVRHNIVQTDLGSDKGVVYRLRTSDMAHKAAADKLCANLSDRNIGCFVVRLPEAPPAPAAVPKAASPSEESETPAVPMGNAAEG